MPISPYTRKKLREWTPQQKREYYDAYRRGNDRAMAAMTPDVDGDSNERRIARNNLRYWVGEQLSSSRATPPSTTLAEVPATHANHLIGELESHPESLDGVGAGCEGTPTTTNPQPMLLPPLRSARQ